MRYKELLERSEHNYQNALQLIRSNCKVAIKTYFRLGRLLSRLDDHPIAPIWSGYPRSNRTPVDSTLFAQNLVDSKLKEANFKALRSNSIFCTPININDIGNMNLSTNYFIFPYDGFYFTSSRYLDLTNQLPMRPPGNMTYEFMMDKIENTMSGQDFVEFGGFFNDDFSKALMQYKEIYILGDYIAINCAKYYTQIIKDIFLS